ncbi:hypothetical protein FGB62_119g06 [Gracilaria domingensis]|nr:hypothetical protein FGB62_119g06 [Gracilaria domingensis]
MSQWAIKSLMEQKLHSIQNKSAKQKRESKACVEERDTRSVKSRGERRSAQNMSLPESSVGVQRPPIANHQSPLQYKISHPLRSMRDQAGVVTGSEVDERVSGAVQDIQNRIQNQVGNEPSLFLGRTRTSIRSRRPIGGGSRENRAIQHITSLPLLQSVPHQTGIESQGSTTRSYLVCQLNFDQTNEQERVIYSPSNVTREAINLSKSFLEASSRNNDISTSTNSVSKIHQNKSLKGKRNIRTREKPVEHFCDGEGNSRRGHMQLPLGVRQGNRLIPRRDPQAQEA